MPSKSPKPVPRRRHPRKRPQPAATAGQSLWDACVIWELGDGLALATLGARGVA